MAEELISVQVWMPKGMQVAQVSAVFPNDKCYPQYLRIESCHPVMNEDKSQMTREEAINRFHQIMYPESFNSSIRDADQKPASNFAKDRKWAIKAISAYEALGLLKFEEVGPTIIQIIRNNQGKILNALLLN